MLRFRNKSEEGNLSSSAVANKFKERNGTPKIVITSVIASKLSTDTRSDIENKANKKIYKPS